MVTAGAAAAKRWRDAHPGAAAKATRKRRRVLLNVIQAAKSAPCMDCGGSFPPECMDLDHRDGEDKVANVSQMRSFSMERVLAEIAKCDSVCANCHRIRTARRRAEEATQHGRLRLR